VQEYWVIRSGTVGQQEEEIGEIEQCKSY